MFNLFCSLYQVFCFLLISCVFLQKKNYFWFALIFLLFFLFDVALIKRRLEFQKNYSSRFNLVWAP